MAINIVNSLGAGSGIDVKQLAQDLVDAQRAPSEALIQAKIDASTARISGYSAARFSIGSIKDAFAGLNDKSDFESVSVSVSQPSAFSVSTTAAASAGTSQLNVTQLARSQVSPSNGFSAADAVLNGGAAFTLNFSLDDGGAAPVLPLGGGSGTSIAVSTATPEGVVSAINAATDANGDPLGITAKLVNTGDATNPYSVVVTGQDGAAQAFTLSSSTGDISFGAPAQTATDAEFTLDGLPMSRPSNTLDDVIDGVTIELNTTTTGAARIDLTRDTAGLRSKIDTLVSAYNDAIDAFAVLGDSSSDVPDFGGALAGESYLQTLKGQLQGLITGTSSTPGDSIQAPRDIGLSFDRFGKLTLDETKFNAVAADKYDEIVTMFSADTNNQSIYSPASAGTAGDALYKLDKMLRSTGIIAGREKTQNQQIARYEEQLTTLSDQMDRLLQRYMSQFSVMDALVGEASSTRESMQSSFDSISNMYKNN